MKKIICTAAVLAMLCAAFAGCSNKDGGSDNSEATTAPATTASTTASTTATENATTDTQPSEYHQVGFDYLYLVNKNSELPEGWEDELETVHMTNSVGNDVEVEKKAYDAYLNLKSQLEAEGIYVDLDSARRSLAEQQRIMDEFTRDYGADYAAKTVAPVGYSEHHTGLALDLYLIIDGKDVVLNEEMMKYPEIWEVIHSKLAENGFILRYLEDKEHITGYAYEPWHIRYLDDVDKAKEITSKGITLEEYLGVAEDAKPVIECGGSELLPEDELQAAALQVKCSFATKIGYVLKGVRYAGDDYSSNEKLDTVKEYSGNDKFTQTAAFRVEYTPSEKSTKKLESEEGTASAGNFKDELWVLACTEEDGWEVVTKGESIY